MQLSNKPSVLIGVSTLHTNIHRNVNIIIPKFKESASDSKWSFKNLKKKTTTKKGVWHLRVYSLFWKLGEGDLR